jgi:2-succinyl-5-enolpyruvyl-6-hydroxy-3-cyclohexene-1-carboxylate synthase
MTPATDTALLLRAFSDELARCGMRHAVTSPGSRNTPLVLALVREARFTAHSHIDERCAGFFAVGAAKASGTPVAVTCTSGTATANLGPAVIEAFHARVPLIVLTADRPPELREVGAGQTIDQVGLFGRAVRWFFEVGVHDAAPERLRWIRTLACRAYWTAAGPVAGPVHLNFPLREPLIADDPLPDDPVPGRSDGRPWVVRETATVAATEPYRIAARRPVLIGGAGAPGLAELAAKAAIPLLADPLGGQRHGPAAIAHYDLLLRSPAFTASHRPDLIVRAGELPTSKPLRAWLASHGDVEQVVVDPAGIWQDPDGATARRVAGLSDEAAPADPEWLPAWRAAEDAVREAVEATLGGELSEPLVAARLVQWLPPEATLFVAASMPIRDIEEFAPARDAPPRLLANRGANGIDGTVSSAFGAAAVSDGPVVLLIGDVALAHDIGGLLAARRLGLNLTIVLLDNDGGGIFHFLPVATQTDAFETHVATPHGLDFAHAAALYGCTHVHAEDMPGLEAHVSGALSAGTTTIIEARTDRAANRRLHQLVADAAGRALRSA